MQPIFHWLVLGFASAKTQILGFASAKTQIKGFVLAPKYQHVGIPNAKFWCRGHCQMPTPDARYFSSQWNIGLKVPYPGIHPTFKYYVLRLNPYVGPQMYVNIITEVLTLIFIAYFIVKEGRKMYRERAKYFKVSLMEKSM